MKPDHRHMKAVILSLAVSAAPHALRLPVWVTICCAGCWGYAVQAVERGWYWPGRRTRTAMTLVGILLVLTTYGGRFYRETAVSMLVMMIAIKPFEIEGYRDKIITLFLSYFLAITCLLFSSSLSTTLYMVVSVLTTTTVLIHVNALSLDFRAHMRLAVKTMAAAAPLALILFFLFPRLQGGIWGFPQSDSGVSGFTDRLDPGSVGRIVKNDDVAFRVKFSGKMPERADLYWRGIVFSQFDGKTWHYMPHIPGPRPLEAASGSTAYEIILEPHREKWLFALDLPVKTDAHAFLRGDYTLAAPYHIRRQVRYRVVSALRYRTGALNRSGALNRWDHVYTALPAEGNSRAKELARYWKSRSTSAGDVVDQALRFFADQPFVYTLNARESGIDPIDAFLFETQRGWCEQYASAFAFLMRAADIPARVVGGYLGGEANPFGDYLIVRQSDAHAWAEVWLEEKGWTRADPTIAVAPARRLQITAAAASDEKTGIWRHPSLSPLHSFWRTTRLGWDAINNYWIRQVVGYTFNDQQKFLVAFGFQSVSLAAYLKFFFISLLSIIGMTVIPLYFLSRRRGRPFDSTTAAYDIFLKKMKQSGVPKHPAQGPVHYARWAGEKRPDLKEDIDRITRLYVSLRYENKKGNAALGKLFRRRIRQFRPKKISLK